MSRYFNRRTFPFVTVALNAIAAGYVWADTDHATAMFGLALAGFLALDIVRTEARVRRDEAERLSRQVDTAMKEKMVNSWQ